MTRLSSSRNESRTAFLSHWWVIHLPPVFSATRSLLLEPLVGDPLAAGLLGDAQLAGIEPGDGVLDRLAQRRRRVGGRKRGALLPGLVDDFLLFFHIV